LNYGHMGYDAVLSAW